jgi:hypothetical protein
MLSDIFSKIYNTASNFVNSLENAVTLGGNLSFNSLNPLDAGSFKINSDATYITKLNQTKHEFEIYLDNGAGNSDYKQYAINPNAIVNLNIEETLADWITRGTLTFLYNPDLGVQNILNTSTGGEANATTGVVNLTPKPPHMFRCDGNDLLRIRIKPKLDTDTSDTNTIKMDDDPHWTMSYLFSIYDMEDIDLPPGAQNQASSAVKCIKLYFWDSWYQKMISNVMEYSTAQSVDADREADIAEGKYANPGTILTGKAIKEIIELSLQSDSSQDGYTGTTSPDPSLLFNYEPTSDEDWDDGLAKIFYTAPAEATAFDSLMYVYDKHISSISQDDKYDFCLLSKERGPTETDVGQFKLMPMSTIFDRAGNGSNSPGPYQIEHFFLQSYTDSLANKEVPSKVYLAPISDGSNANIDLQTEKYGTISSYRFVDIAPYTNTLDFTNKPVYSIDFKNRAFNIEFKKNSVTAAREFIAKKYISGVYKNSSASEEDLFLVTLNNDKQSKNTRPEFSLHGDDADIRQHTGLTKLLKTGLFLNTAINFRTLGLTSRQAGRFIAIDKTQGVDPGDFPDKFYGQWFVINVKHIIESEIFYNDITAVKIHRFDKMSTNFENTI